MKIFLKDLKQYEMFDHIQFSKQNNSFQKKIEIDSFDKLIMNNSDNLKK